MTIEEFMDKLESYHTTILPVPSFKGYGLYAGNRWSGIGYHNKIKTVVVFSHRENEVNVWWPLDWVDDFLNPTEEELFLIPVDIKDKYLKGLELLRGNPVHDLF